MLHCLAQEESIRCLPPWERRSCLFGSLCGVVPCLDRGKSIVLTMLSSCPAPRGCPAPGLALTASGMPHLGRGNDLPCRLAASRQTACWCRLPMARHATIMLYPSCHIGGETHRLLGLEETTTPIAAKVAIRLWQLVKQSGNWYWSAVSHLEYQSSNANRETFMQRKSGYTLAVQTAAWL